MFCTECGKEIPEGARFCVNCGTSAGKSPIVKKSAAKDTEGKNPGQNQLAAGKAVLEKLEAMKPVAGKAVMEKLEAVKPVTGEIGKKLKIKLDKKKLLAIGAVVVVLLLFLVFKGGGKGPGAGFSSPEKAFDAWMTGYATQDFDLTLQAEPDFVIEYEGGEAALKATLQRNHNNSYADQNDGIIRSFEAVGHTMLEKDEAEQIVQRMRKAYGVDVKVSDVAVIHNRMVYLNDDSKNDGGAIGTTGYAFKYKGKWYYLSVEDRMDLN